MPSNGITKRRRLARAWNGNRYLNPSRQPAVPAPSSLGATNTGAYIAFAWTDESDGSAGTVIQRSANGTTGWTDVATAGAGIVAATAAIPSAGTWYFRALGIFNGTRSTTPSSNASVTITAIIPPPTSVLATVSGYDIILTWNDETSGTGQHVIQSSADGVTGWSTIATKSTGVETHTVTGLSDGTYYYRIYATVGSDASEYRYANATIDTPLSAPSSFTAVASGTSVAFTWVDNNGLGQVRIEVSTTSGSTGFSTLATLTASDEAYTATSVAVGAYWFRAVAVDGADTSPYSTAVAVTVSSGGSGSDGISSITGTISNGATVTVNGLGFGTMGGDVLGFMYGTEGANNSLITAATPTIGSNFGAQSGNNCLFSNARTRTGRSMSMRKWRTNPSGTTVNFCGFGPNNVHQSELFFSYWRHASMDIAWSASGKNYKMYYIFSNGFHEGTGGSETPQAMLHVPANQNSFVMGANQGSSDPNSGNTAGWNAANSLGSWQLYENWLKMNSDYSVQDGEFDVWRDGVLGLSDHTFSWFGTGPVWTTKPTHWEDIRLGHYDSGMTGFVADYTDVYVASTRARVVFGNASTWSAVTAREIQLARQANWTSTAISSVVINYGAFTSGQTVYMYVVKSDGSLVSSTGYPVVLP